MRNITKCIYFQYTEHHVARKYSPLDEPLVSTRVRGTENREKPGMSDEKNIFSQHIGLRNNRATKKNLPQLKIHPVPSPDFYTCLTQLLASSPPLPRKKSTCPSKSAACKSFSARFSRAFFPTSIFSAEARAAARRRATVCLIESWRARRASAALRRVQALTTRPPSLHMHINMHIAVAEGGGMIPLPIAGAPAACPLERA